VDIQAYITSGVLELYVSGALTEQEMREVEHNAQLYPEVKQELDEIEASFFNLANELHAGPRASLKDEILKNVKLQSVGQKILPKEEKKITTPVEVPTQEEKKVESKIVSLTPASKGNYRMAFAASIALLIASLAGLGITWNNWSQAKEELANMKVRLEESTTQYASLNTTYKEEQKIMESLRSPMVMKLKLAGQAISPTSEAMVHWDKASKKVMVDPMNLPMTDDLHDYQVWAIVNGKPVDLGVFSPGNNDMNMYEMKSVDAPQAFAITLERKGGSETPTMEEMYVMGKI
jgi:anti-sigma-K factor RskA